MSSAAAAASAIGANVHSGTYIGDGTFSGPGLEAWQTLAIFGGGTLLLTVVITLLVLAPSWVRGPRYRPSLTWFAAPVWLNPPSGEHLVSAANDEAVGAAPTTTEGGGASARW